MIAEHGLGRREGEALGAGAVPIEIPVPAQAGEPRVVRRDEPEPGDRPLAADLIGVEQFHRDLLARVYGADDLRTNRIVRVAQRSRRDGARRGRRCSCRATSAMRADRLEDLTAENVAKASTSVPAAVAREEIVAQSTVAGGVMWRQSGSALPVRAIDMTRIGENGTPGPHRPPPDRPVPTGVSTGPGSARTPDGRVARGPGARRPQCSPCSRPCGPLPPRLFRWSGAGTAPGPGRRGHWPPR